MHYVIVGNGVCGIEAALVLRARDAKARITLVSDEHDHFFSRPALMYVFAGQTSLRDTEPYDRGLYERLRFEQRLVPLQIHHDAIIKQPQRRRRFRETARPVGMPDPRHHKLAPERANRLRHAAPSDADHSDRK